MTLRELSAEYYTGVAALQERVRLLEQRRGAAEDPGEALLLADRIRILRAMLRETREVAVMCEHYYERGYCRNAKYTI